MDIGMLSAIPATIQAGTGIYQLIRGNQLANSMERPNYSIPQEVLDNLTDAEIQALRGLPAEQRQQYLDNVMRSQQASLGAMDDRKGGLAGLAGVQQQSNDAYRNLLTMDAQARMDAEQRLQGVRTQVADAKDKEWQLNELNPYMETMQAAEGMRGAGLQNIMGGVTAGAQMGLDYAKYMKLLNSFGGSNQNGNTYQTPMFMNQLLGSDPINRASAQDLNKSYNTSINNAASVMPKIF